MNRSAPRAASAEPLAAFPTAEGFGAQATGGRGGKVYHVANLDDAGPGSLRFGIENAEGPTTIVFDVGGAIRLQSPLWINKSCLTLAGQTAPGDGIAVIGNMTSVTDAHDVVIRYMRFRCGAKAANSDSLNVCGCRNVIFDHISTSWGTDETLSITRSNCVTVQHCIIAEALDIPGKHHAYGSLVRGNVDAEHPGGYTFCNNLWVSNSRRNPGFGSRQTYNDAQDVHAKLQLDLVNNVIYNWGARSVHTVQSEDDMEVNLVNNTYIAGPDTRFPKEILAMELEVAPRWKGAVHLFESGNQIDSDRDSVHQPVEVDRSAVINWNFVAKLDFPSARHGFPTVTTRNAQDAYLAVLAHAGASLVRDIVDERIISNVLYRNGEIISSETVVGGFPPLQGGAPPLDTDRDGIPDVWEVNAKLDPANAADGRATASNGSTNLENYLNFLTGDAITVSQPNVAPTTTVPSP